MILEEALCQHYLSSLFHDLKPAQDIKLRLSIPFTYGEILYPGVSKLLSTLELTENDVFLDLGSGSGKVVLQVFLQTPVKKAYGIEFVPELHQQSVCAAQRLERELPDVFSAGRTLSFIQGDFLQTPFPPATVVLLGSPCFSIPMLKAVGSMINSMPSVHHVFSLRPLPALDKLRFKKAYHIECSWDSALCYKYSK